MMVLKILLLLGIVSIATYTDMKENKIRNKHLLIALIIGILLSIISGGFEGFRDSILGILVPFGILFIFFILRMLGAGDIKLFSTVGAIMGVNFAINNMIYSFLLAGVIVILKLILTRKLFTKLKGIYFFFANMFLTNNISEFKSNKEEKFPFGIAILVGSIVQLIVGYNFI